VGQNNCELTEDGKKARDELLALLYPDNAYTDSQLGRDTDVHRGQTIPKILGKKTGGIQQGKLEQFFERLLRLLKGKVDAKNREVIEYLQKYQLKQPYEQIWEGDIAFYLPKKLYKTSVSDIDLKKHNQKTQKGFSKHNHKSQSSSGNVVDLFWHLDYKHQERAFEDALEEQSKCAAFSIVAPCETTQQWIFHRLVRKIALPGSALILPPIGLKQHPMRHKFEYFWEDLADRFGTRPEPEAVLKGICHTEVNRPLILTVYEFRQFEKVQRQILSEFWEPLTQMIADSPRTERSRVVLFLADQSCPSDETEKVLRLAPLEKIPQNDVKSWLNSPLVVPQWQLKGDERFVDRAIEELSADNCQDPYAVLDKMCFKFGVEGGIVDVEEAWKWAS
jgi:hypothetical protein